MKLEINSKSPLINRHFGMWLINNHIKKLLMQELNSSKLKSWDAHFNETFKDTALKQIKSERIIQLGIDNLICITGSGSLYIKIAPWIFVPGLDRIKVETLCKLINYGNTTIPGVPIFTNVYQYIVDNIGTYVELYMGEMTWQ